MTWSRAPRATASQSRAFTGRDKRCPATRAAPTARGRSRSQGQGIHDSRIPVSTSTHEAGGATITPRTRADSAPPWCTLADQWHGDAHRHANRDREQSTSDLLTACASRAPRRSQPCWQSHCHAAIAPVRGAVKSAVSPPCLARTTLSPQPREPKMPQHAVPNSCLWRGRVGLAAAGETWPRRLLIDLGHGEADHRCPEQPTPSMFSPDLRVVRSSRLPWRWRTTISSTAPVHGEAPPARPCADFECRDNRGDLAVRT